MVKPTVRAADLKKENQRVIVPHFVSLSHEFANDKAFVYVASRNMIMSDVSIYYGTPEQGESPVPSKAMKLTVRMGIQKRGIKSVQAFEFDVVPGINEYPDKFDVEKGDVIMIRCISECNRDAIVSLSFNKSIRL